MIRLNAVRTLTEMEAVRRAYRMDAAADHLEAVQRERDGLRADLVAAGSLMLRSIEGRPHAVRDMKAFLTRSNRHYLT